MFFVHDLGHMGVTGNWTLDRVISIAIADFVGGLSVGWYACLLFVSSYTSNMGSLGGSM